MPKERCETCRFYVGASHGDCHRYPPRRDDGFPIVYPDVWCGEWQPRTIEPALRAGKPLREVAVRRRVVEVAR